MDIPASVQSDPVFMNIGPSPVKDALMALVSGSSYNYMIFSSPADAQRVSRMILTARSSTGPALAVANAPTAEPPQATLYGGQGVVPADGEAGSVEPMAGPQVQPSAVPTSVPTGVNIQELATKEGKTPGQILDELQKRQLEVLDQQYGPQNQSPPQ